MTLEVVELVSTAGDALNEDRAGHARYPSGTAAAWVIDGATGLAEREWVPEGPTDAAWLAARLSGLLAEHDPDGTAARDYFEDLLTRVSAAYRAAVPAWTTLPPWALPSAAGMWLRTHGSALELAWQGDCVAVVESAGAGAVTVAGAEPARAWEDDINTVVRTRLAAAGTLDSPIIDVVMDELRRRRARLNRADGYWMLGIDPRAAAAIEVRTLALGPSTRILLASDGLWRLVDHFDRYDAVGLLNAAFARGLAALIDELRSLEDADRDCRRVPRVKPRDDATGLTLAL